MTRTKVEYSDTLLLRLAEYTETGSWRQKQQIEHGAPGAFATRAERLAALEKRGPRSRNVETLPLLLPKRHRDGDIYREQRFVPPVGVTPKRAPFRNRKPVAETKP